VRPGDTLRCSAEVLEVSPSRSKPDRGILKLALAARNQMEETVMTVTFIILLKRKPDA
jgi:acyl dehydratase